jgi:hypothetical protein
MISSPDARTEAFSWRAPIDLARRFAALCKALGISRTEGMNRAVAMWVEFMKD